MSRWLTGALRTIADWRAWLLAWLLVFGVALQQSRELWIGPSGRAAAVAELMLYWGSWLLFPGSLLLALHAVRHLIKRRPWRVLRSSLGLAVCLGLIWGRFVEPYQLRVQETNMSVGCGMRVALVSDLHVGLFMRTGQLDELVQRLNRLDVDAILIAGDWTYQPQRDLRGAFAPIAGLRLRPYAVLGNHDEGVSGSPEITEPLREALGSLGVRLIDGQRVPFGRCELDGAGDYLAGSARRDIGRLMLLDRGHAPRRVPRVLLAHEPETLAVVPKGFADAVLVGHTHGGQIDIRWLTRPILHRFAGPWVGGAYQLGSTKLFVTTGIGTDHLPLRIGVPPVIDILTL